MQRHKAVIPFEWVEPIEVEEAAALPEGNWLYEVKWDGYRVIARKDRTGIRLLTRKAKDLALTFPRIAGVAAQAIAKLPCASVVLDGEVVALDSDGRPSFSLLQASGRKPHSIVYYAFDLLALDGRDLRSEPIERRKEQLEGLVAGTSVRPSPALAAPTPKLVELVRQHRLEGLVAKPRGSSYHDGGWIKWIYKTAQEFVIGGFELNGRSVAALLVGYYEDNRLRYAGSVTKGLLPMLRTALAKALESLRIEQCPFDDIQDSNTTRFSSSTTRSRLAGSMRWIKPLVVVEIRFLEWTSSGRIRHPEFKTFRPDKKPTDVTRKSAICPPTKPKPKSRSK